MTSKILVLGSLAYSLRNFRGPLICAFRDYGLSVHAAAPGLDAHDETRKWLAVKNIQSHSVPLSRAGLSPFNDIASLRAFIRLLMKLRPDYFLGYTIKPVVWGLIAAWIVGVPNRVALITGLGYAFTGEASGKRRLIQKIARGLYSFALRRATLIFFQNPDDRMEFDRLGLLPEGVRVEVVNGSGVDVEAFSPEPFPQHPIRFLLIARLLGDKGIREYAAAAAKVKATHPAVEFHLVGGLDPNPDGISEGEVLRWREAGDIVWHGALSDVRPAIASSHVYVLPSYREGTPRTVLESMAMGRSVITTDAPGCRETVVDGHNGFLVPPRSTDALVEAMLHFVEHPELVSTMGAKARQVAEQKYDVRKVNEFMLEAMGLNV